MCVLSRENTTASPDVAFQYALHLPPSPRSNSGPTCPSNRTPRASSSENATDVTKLKCPPITRPSSPSQHSKFVLTRPTSQKPREFHCVRMRRTSPHANGILVYALFSHAKSEPTCPTSRTPRVPHHVKMQRISRNLNVPSACAPSTP